MKKFIESRQLWLHFHNYFWTLDKFSMRYNSYFYAKDISSKFSRVFMYNLEIHKHENEINKTSKKFIGTKYYSEYKFKTFDDTRRDFNRISSYSCFFRLLYWRSVWPGKNLIRNSRFSYEWNQEEIWLCL